MKLNGIEIVKPEDMKVNPVELSKIITMASGKTVKEVVGIKRRFVLPYKGLKPETAEVFKEIYYSGQSAEFEYEDSNGTNVVEVYIESLPYSILKYNPRLNQNVTITLEEV
jgi:hypothetical protein